MFTLVRDKRTGTAILGSLYLNGAFICYTLENAAKAIPVGLYSIENSKSPKFGRELPLLFSDKVPSSRGVRIHSGNTYKDSAACVLVGMRRDDVRERIDESKDAEKMVTMLCRSVCQLSIVENF
ncbi:DUF5675 family protein [uncultured Fibrobacter sp.]|uniref:DUF5675 family protein n=1 Tax=uncultured Fibrobacter sp. TaxID=261512 RepID=UPI0025DDB911|nr:DUF5675 family protein [uncultured Fibrobacter sp.]